MDAFNNSARRYPPTHSRQRQYVQCLQSPLKTHLYRIQGKDAEWLLNNMSRGRTIMVFSGGRIHWFNTRWAQMKVLHNMKQSKTNMTEIGQLLAELLLFQHLNCKGKHIFPSLIFVIKLFVYKSITPRLLEYIWRCNTWLCLLVCINNSTNVAVNFDFISHLFSFMHIYNWHDEMRPR